MDLKMRDIEWDSDGFLLRIRGQRPRVVPMAKVGNPILDQWIKTRGEMLKTAKGGHPHVFISTATFKPITRLTVYRAIKHAITEANATSTAARNTFAARQIFNGTEADIIDEWMGYKTEFSLDRHKNAITRSVQHKEKVRNRNSSSQPSVNFLSSKLNRRPG